jgi:hypothetical protein
MKTEWLNSFSLYRQYTYQFSAKAKLLCERYGWFFDDEYAYYFGPKRKDIMLRVPIWLWPEKGSGRFCEKSRRWAHDKQTRLPVRVKKPALVPLMPCLTEKLKVEE